MTHQPEIGLFAVKLTGNARVVDVCQAQSPGLNEVLRHRADVVEGEEGLVVRDRQWVRWRRPWYEATRERAAANIRQGRPHTSVHRYNVSGACTDAGVAMLLGGLARKFHLDAAPASRFPFGLRVEQAVAAANAVYRFLESGPGVPSTDRVAPGLFANTLHPRLHEQVLRTQDYAHRVDGPEDFVGYDQPAEQR